MEAIFVLDGEIDNSLKILEELQTGDWRVKRGGTDLTG